MLYDIKWWCTRLYSVQGDNLFRRFMIYTHYYYHKIQYVYIILTTTFITYYQNTLAISNLLETPTPKFFFFYNFAFE